MAKKKANYYKRLNDDMRDVYAERNILKNERDNARKSAEAYKRKLELAYADIERRENELREKEAMTADERLRMKYEIMREQYRDMKPELRRYRSVIKELEELACDLHADLMEYGCTPNAHRANYKPRFEALGIEVDK